MIQTYREQSQVARTDMPAFIAKCEATLAEAQATNNYHAEKFAAKAVREAKQGTFIANAIACESIARAHLRQAKDAAYDYQPSHDAIVTADDIRQDASFYAAEALHDRASRTHGHLREQLRAAAKVFAIALALTLPGHADARESVPTPAYLNPPANCALYLSFEDHSSLAYCETDGFIGYDSDGPVTGWHLIAWAHTSAR